MNVRAKFTVTSVTQFSPTDPARRIVFSPRYDETIEEDRRFAQASPTGELSIYVNNPAAVAEFAIGKTFYLDFTEVPPVPAPVKPVPTSK